MRWPWSRRAETVQGALPSTTHVDSALAPVRVERRDGWKNVITGMGVPGRDWRTATEIVPRRRLTREEIDTLYKDDYLFSRIVDGLPEECTRRWCKLTIEGDDDGKLAKEILDAHEELDAAAKFAEWDRLGSKDGGSVMLLGTDDGQALDQPLDPARVKTLQLHVTERWAWVVGEAEVDPTKPGFGQPAWYDLAPRALMLLRPPPGGLPREWDKGIVRVHASRVIVHRGVHISERERALNAGWGLSRGQRAVPSIQRYAEFWEHISAAVKHLSQTTLKLEGLKDLVASDQDETVIAKLKIIGMFRSMFGLIPLDATESLEEKGVSLAGVDTLALRFFDDVAGAAEMPLTRLFGHAPSGFSSDDEPGMRNWYDAVAQRQRRIHLKPIDRVNAILLAIRGKKDAKWHTEFNPLAEETADEVSKRRNMDALTAKTYVEINAIDPEEVRGGVKADPANPYTMIDDAEFERRAEEAAAQEAEAAKFKAEAAAKGAQPGGKPKDEPPPDKET